MARKIVILILIILSTSILAGPVLQMNRAFVALSDLIPFITDRNQFMEKKNETLITGKIVELQSAFKAARHDSIMKDELFAPSYALINENISGSLEAFEKDKKDYAHWRLREVTSLCLDCHTRMPPSHTSSFQSGELTVDKSKFQDSYNLGIAQLIVRRYPDAKASFIRSIQDKIIKKDFTDIILPIKQLLLIESKVLKNPENLRAFLDEYQKKKELPADVHKTLAEWMQRLKHWQTNKFLKKGLQSDKDVDNFIVKELAPLKKQSLYGDGYDVDLLIVSGLLSNYLFENPTSIKTPEISFWLGWAEKYLKRDNFFGSGDLFLKQCIKRHPTHPAAKMCLEEYRESVEFDFSGSSGTNIPRDVQRELDDLTKLIKTK